MNDVIVEVVGQQRLRQLTKKALQNRRRNMNVTQLVKIDRDTYINVNKCNSSASSVSFLDKC